MSRVPSFYNFSPDSTCVFFPVYATHVKDAIDLLQGHYIVSVNRDMTPPSQKGGLEAIAVSTVQMTNILFYFL